jgi:DNA-binding NtrC family response regulator
MSSSLRSADTDIERDASPLVPKSERSSVRILVLDQESGSQNSCKSVLASEGYQVEVERKLGTALRRLRREPFHLVLADERAGDNGSVDDILEVTRESSSPILAIVMTEHASAEASVRARQRGAWDYLARPFTAMQLIVLVERGAYTAIRMKELQRSGSGREDEGILADNGVTILGVSDAMREALNRALKVAPTDASVFLNGESGTGKELFARYIHAESQRANKNLVPVNCAALPGELLESELFGHRKGAFTGAVQDKPGLIEVADRGTLFLDELAEMPTGLQPKLLRVLQDGSFRRVGGTEVESNVDVRFISATNHAPEEALSEGRMRHDLYYRLRGVPIRIPPLRERPEDIPVLARHFVKTFWMRHHRPDTDSPVLSDESIDLLRNYSWPGNVRELKNVIEQLVILSEPSHEDGTEILELSSEVLDLDLDDGRKGGTRGYPRVSARRPYDRAKEEITSHFEQEYLKKIMARAEGNMSEAARMADLDLTTLYRLMKKHDLSRNELEKDE